LLQLRRDALTQGKTFSVKGLPQRLRELAGLYGVADLLTAAA
jgi:phospholipid transport system transporter-binding protein